jgi:hypothetical protein
MHQIRKAKPTRHALTPTLSLRERKAAQQANERHAASRLATTVS